ncbi:Histidine phosphatase superfamily, clade-1 [Artemisia annua]|uniref:Histidine phosphatase superfamily, clade-1 n=1 Tax=Artemisia annua TaxID=35608 RepID=A0A2U1MFF9_ARTAN|nr:Histidine phosphatase superfamily, clade-1 [Artemisia annua]
MFEPNDPNRSKFLPKRIILVRHGESEGNLDNSTYTTIPDHQITLTPQGISQARHAGTQIQRVVSNEKDKDNWRVYFCWNMTRSSLREIAKAFPRKSVIGVREECRIREQDFGNFQVTERMKDIKESRQKFGRFFYRFPEGESAADVYDRVSTFLESLWRDIDMNRFNHDPSKDLNLIIVSHGLASRVFLMKWFKWTVEQFEYLHNFSNCEYRVMQLGVGGEYSLAVHHSDEEMQEWGLSPEMIAGQKWRAHAEKGASMEKLPWDMEVIARAPGKIILSGEHAVVYGSTAVAAAIDLYTYVSLTYPPPPHSPDALILHLKDAGLEFSWPINRLKEALSPTINTTASSPTSCSAETIKVITTLVLKEHTIPDSRTEIAAAVVVFLWLYTSIQGTKPARVVVSSELPLGSGLGSSAAYCVSMSGALLASSGSLYLDFNSEDWLSLGENEQKLANEWAFEGEKIIHGNPSGIDNTVSTLDTMTSVFAAVDNISNELASTVQLCSSNDLDVVEKEKKVEELMEMNQGLLQCMGVSHASIETVISTTHKYKLSSKLTGADGGGCVITLLPALLSASVVDAVTAELEQCGFQSYIAGIGGKGLEIRFGGVHDIFSI